MLQNVREALCEGPGAQRWIVLVRHEAYVILGGLFKGNLEIVHNSV